MNSDVRILFWALFLLAFMPSYAFAQVGAGEFTTLLIGLAVFLALFIIFRQVVCWYWKLNEIVQLLRDIRDLLKASTGDR